MSCAACSASVEKAVSRLDGVFKAEVNLLQKSMSCEYNSELISSKNIIKAVEKAGFSAKLQRTQSENNQKDVARDDYTPIKSRLIVSTVFLILIMYISMGHMIKLPLPPFMHGLQNALSFAFMQFILTLPIIYVNRKFYFSGFKALMRRAPNMDSLIAVSSSAALIYGIFAIFMIGYGLGHNEYEIVQRYVSNLYFESACMILTLVTLGKFLEEKSKSKTGAALEKLMDISPKTATVMRNGVESEIASDEIVVGDIVIIRPGNKIPVDGIVEDGISAVDESALTGESIPADKNVGDSVLCASINQSGYMKIRAVKVGKDMTLSKIIDLITDAGATKAPVSRLADKISGIFVPVVMIVAFLSVIIWLVAGKSFEFALSIGICVLVISCPCALGLATPVAITVAVGRCASKGILIKTAESLELLHSVDTVLLDKTGTITNGKPSVTDIIPIGISQDVLAKVSASIEFKSEHPLARAIVEYASNTELYQTEDFNYIPGKGVRANIEGDLYYGGNKSYMDELKVDISTQKSISEKLASEGKTPIYFAKKNNFIGIIAVADTIKSTSFDAIKALQNMNIDIIMLTGDNKITANAIKENLGIEKAIAEVMPQDKEKVVSDLRKEGKKVAMVGDGINDSPALMRADVGIAIAGGTDIAIDCADIVLMKSDLRDVAQAIFFSKKTIRNIKQNLFWAFFYNILGIPIAAGILFPICGITLSPMIGAAAMSLSSVFVVTNALRLYKS